MTKLYSVVHLYLNLITRILSMLHLKKADPDTAPMEAKHASQAHIPVRFRDTLITEAEFPDHSCESCTVMLNKELDGRLTCAILHERDQKPEFWRAFHHIAEHVAASRIHRPSQNVDWLLMSYSFEARGNVSFDVWDVSFSKVEGDESPRVSWSETQSDRAKEWILRAEPMMELAKRIKIRRLTSVKGLGIAV